MNERTLAAILGILAGVLLLVGALVSLTTGIVLVVAGASGRGLNDFGFAVIEGVVGIITIFFATVSAAPRSQLGLAGGVILVVLALVDWAALGFLRSVFSTLGVVLTLLAGLLFLVDALTHRR